MPPPPVGVLSEAGVRHFVCRMPLAQNGAFQSYVYHRKPKASVAAWPQAHQK